MQKENTTNKGGNFDQPNVTGLAEKGAAVELFNMDCMDLMKKYPDKYFDLAIVDPPYMDVFDTNMWTTAKDIGQKDYKDKINILEGKKPDEAYFKELMRVSKNQIIWGGNYFCDQLPISRGWIVWDKDNSENYFSDCELAWTSFDKILRRFKWKWHGMLQQNMKDKEQRIHPTQKPVKLYQWTLETYASEKISEGIILKDSGFKVLDTHLGSGSSAIAAFYFGCQFVGCELDKEYFDKAKKRFDEQTQQTKLF